MLRRRPDVFVEATPALTMLAPEHAWQVEENLAAVTQDLRRQVAAATRADADVDGSSTHTGHRIMGSLAVRLVRAGRWPVAVVP